MSETPSHSKQAPPPRRIDGAPAKASPAAAGPAGALLEGHVGAQYLLPLLSGGEARGLPGVVVTRVAFQRASLDFSMDDVIVCGHDRRGEPATLEVQAKRTLSFTTSDAVFADVVALACRAMRKPDFQTTRYELAVAIARTSTTIEQHVQEALRWAREYQDPVTFFARLNQAGVAHQSMRDFVAAFRGHMAKAGASHEDADVWLLLSRFQVLAFDCEQPGSVCGQLARERCAMLLAARETARAAELWDTLQQIALETDAKGGDMDRATLVDRLTSERNYRFAGDRRLHGAREQLAENARNALATISTRIGKVTIDRTAHVDAALSALDHGRYLIIQGGGGVGKSGALVQMVERVQVESRVIVVAPNRIPGGGWAALRAQLGCEANARELLTDLAGDGGGTLFIDGLDRFDKSEEQQTVVDLISAAAQVQGFRVVATARPDFDADAGAWLPPAALRELGVAPPYLIPELTDDEVAALRQADPALAALLAPGHPAKAVVRNLYRLNRLARSVQADTATPFSEAQMAWQWWVTGDSAIGGAQRLERRRLLRALAIHSICSSDPMDASTASAQAVTGLIETDSLRGVNAILIEPAHDVLRDWAIGCLLFEEPEHGNAFEIARAAPIRLVRGVELAARLHAEAATGMAGWKALLERVSGPHAHGSWKRAVLLALARSERAHDALEGCLPALSADNAALFGDLVRALITEDSQRAAPLWAATGMDVTKLPADLVAPRGPSWLNLLLWSLEFGDRIPNGAVPPLVDLYNRWCSATLGQDPLSPHLVGRLYAWLTDVEARTHPAVTKVWARVTATDAPGLSMTAAHEEDLRTAFLLWCKLRPDDAAAYLQGWQAHPHRHVIFRQLLSFLGTAPQAAPREVADLFMAALPEGDNDRDRRIRNEPFSHWSTEFFPASPARAPFFDLLEANPEEGLRLIRAVVAHAIKHRSRGRPPADDRIDVSLATGSRSFPWRRSYSWSRAHDSQVVASALMALEAWAHRRIDAGEYPQAVIDDVLGPDGSPAANLLVAVDVMLSHWPKTRDCLAPFAASAELLALDRDRYAHDVIGDMGLNAWVKPEPAGRVKLQDLRVRPSRQKALDDVLFHFGVYGPDGTREAMRQALRDQAVRLGVPDGATVPTDPRFAAMSALNLLDPANYSRAEDGNGTTITYHLPALEAQLRADLQEKVDIGSADLAIRGRIVHALTEPHCSSELLEQGVAWAIGQQVDTGVANDDQKWIGQTRLIIAALVLRDGTPALRTLHGEWAHAQLAEAIQGEADARGVVQPLQYNQRAIAAVGLLAAYRADPQPTTLERLLHVAVQHDTGMVAVLRAEAAAQRSVPPALLLTLMRLGLMSTVYALPSRDPVDWENVEDYRALREAQEHARKEAERDRLRAAVAAERRWLSGEGNEPGWPELPDPMSPRVRAGISLGVPQSRRQRAKPPAPREYALESSAAARWVSLANDLWYRDAPERLRGLVNHCWAWTAAANGVGCEKDEEPGERADEWNDAYFAAATSAAATLDDAGIMELVLKRVGQLPQDRFLDATTAVLHEIDRLWLSDGLVSGPTVLMVRDTLASRIREFWTWKRLTSECSTSADIHLTSALAAQFMAENEIGKGPRCYLQPPGAERADLLMPMLTRLAVEAAPSTFVALAMLGLLEVRPQVHRLTFLAEVVGVWWQAQGANTEFWNDYGIGRRVCAWVEKAILSDPVPLEVLDSAELTTIVDRLVRSGTPLARILDEKISARRNSGGV